METSSIIQVVLKPQLIGTIGEFLMQLLLKNAPETTPENGGKTVLNDEQRGRQKPLLREGRESQFQKVVFASRQHTPSIDFMGGPTIRHSSPLRSNLGGFLKDEQENVG